jgi:trehalose utilization protein
MRQGDESTGNALHGVKVKTITVRRRRFLREGAWVMTAGLAAVGGRGLLAQTSAPKKRVVLVWSEGTAPKSVYPRDVNGAIADSLANLRGYEIRTASLSDPEQGMSQQALDEADVVLWWGHQKHGEVTDVTVQRIVRRVREGGMGFIALHSAHFAKPLKALLGTSGAWSAYINDGKPHRIRVTDPKHPLARGVRSFTLPKEERYEEPFVVPKPEAVVFDGFHESTMTSARQGLCWTIGKGRFFYFRPGHEEYPVFFMPEVRRILRNATLWAARDEVAIPVDIDMSAPAVSAG